MEVSAMATERTIKAYDKIMESSIWRIDGEDIDLSLCLIELADAIEDEPEDSDWIYLGECGECTAADLLVGSYWALTEWHGGMMSDEYRAMCAIGGIYTSNCASGPDGYGEQAAYEQANEYFQNHA
jgi:hypothetical protein